MTLESVIMSQFQASSNSITKTMEKAEEVQRIGRIKFEIISCDEEEIHVMMVLLDQDKTFHELMNAQSSFRNWGEGGNLQLHMNSQRLMC